MLKDLEFSDIILLADGAAYLKGTPEKDQGLIPVTEEHQTEIASLLAAVGAQFREKSADVSLRIKHMDCIYRAATYEDVGNGRIFFLRRLAEAVPTLEATGLPAPLISWLTDKNQSKGLLLISGGQGSGKTTTAAAVIKARLSLLGGHAVTFENPVEMPLAGAHGKYGRCFQTEIKSEAELGQHIERAHRYSSPNIIFIGEIRSRYAASESLRVALGSSHQLVVATIHGLSVIAALDRLLTWAKEQDGEVACQNLAQTLVGIIHQELFDQELNQRALKVPEFLLLPFGEKSKSIRAKLEDGILNLGDEIRRQRNTMIIQGLEAL